MRKLLRRRANKGQIDADIEDYLAEKTEALIAAGLSPEEARLKARREFGNVTLLKELSSDEWSWAGIEQIMNDTKYAFRSLLRNPAFSLTAIFTLALGIGANAAIFNLLHAVILRSLPVPNAEQLRLVNVVGPREDLESIFSYPVFRQMQDAVSGKGEIAAFSGISPMKAGEEEQVQAELVSGDYFQALRVQPEAGHLLSASDDKITGAYPAVLSDAYWSKRYGRDAAIIGQSINLNNTPVTIVGVASHSFFGLAPGSRPDFWLPVSAQFDLRYKRNVWNSNGDSSKAFLPQPQIRWLSLVARIPDARLDSQVAATINHIYGLDMQREAKGWQDDPAGARALLQSRLHLDAGEKGLGDLRRRFTDPLIVLMSAAGLVLLIASVNLASLALARVIARRKEIAVRCAIGATRGRIISQFITEVLLLSFVGGVFALPVALGASQVLTRWASSGDPMPLDIGVDAPMLLFVLGASIVAGFLFGLLPALEAMNFPLADAMKTHASSVKGMRLPWGRTLIAIQVMFSFVLLTGAVLFVRTFVNYASINLGFNPERVLSAQVDPLGAHFTTEQLLPAYHRVLERVRAIPGVQSVSLADRGLDMGGVSSSGFNLQGRPNGDQTIDSSHVSPEYFSTVGMRLVRGRFFDYHDLAKKPVLAVINAAAARVLFSGMSPIGQHFGDGGDTGHYEVIGIVADARVVNVHELARPMAFYSLDQEPEYIRVIDVRAQGDPKSIEQSVRNAIREAAPSLPVMKVNLLTKQVGSNLLREKLVARLASAFALLALALACLGVYGVLSYAISRRTPEIGIRLALGAETSSVRWMVLREALVVILIGLCLGIPVAVGGTTLVRGLLYGVSAGDPASLALGALALLAIGFLAAFIPAWRASRVDPNVALRYD
jgi:predicted permease